MIKVIRNITRLYHNRNDAELVSAPTGAAASIIAGKTHHRNLAIPTGKAFNDLPKNLTISNALRILAMTRSLRNCRCVLKDEHSMDGLQMWAHIPHRREELRNHHEIDNTDVVEEYEDNQNVDDSNIHQHLATPLPIVPPCVAERPFGGYPFFTRGVITISCHQFVRHHASTMIRLVAKARAKHWEKLPSRILLTPHQVHRFSQL